MNIYVLIGTLYLIVQPINQDKHPTDISSLALELESTNGHRRAYAARELAYLSKRVMTRSQSNDRIVSLEAKGELELLNLKAAPACAIAIEKGFVLGPCADMLRHLNRVDAIGSLKKAMTQKPNLFEKCAINKALNHLLFLNAEGEERLKRNQ